jgi:hypothetical protein
MRKVNCLLPCYILLAVISNSFSAIGQKTATGKKGHAFSLAYGYKTDTKWWREVFDKIPVEVPNNTNDIILKYERNFKNDIRIGIELHFNDESIDPPPFYIQGGYFYGTNVLRFLPFLSYNLIKTKKFSFYISVAAGFYFLNMKAVHRYTNSTYFQDIVDEIIVNKKGVGFDWAGGAGAKFFFNKNIGVFSEIGLHKSVFQAGIIVKTGK